MNDRTLLALPPEAFEALLAEALKQRREAHVLALAASPLAQTSLVEAVLLSGEPDSADARGRALQSLLRWMTDKLRPGGQHSWTAYPWRPYNVLHAFYLQGMTVAKLAERMGISNQTLYNIRPSAIAAAADVLCSELEHPQFTDERKSYAFTDRYQRCSPQEQLVLRMVSIFEEPIPRHWIHLLMQADLQADARVQECIPNLVKERLLMVGSSTRQELLVPPEVRPYVLMRLKPRECTLWHREAGRLYCDERQDYLAAAHHLRQGRDFEMAARLLITHDQEIINQLEIDELARLLDTFQRAELPSVDAWARLNFVAGRVAEWRGELDVAQEKYRTSLQAKDVHTKAEAYYHRGKLFENLDIDEALTHYREGIELLQRQAVRSPLLFQLYIHRAWIFIQNRPDLERAMDDLQQAQKAVQFSDLENRADLHNAWAELYFRRGDLDQAIRRRLQAWMMANTLGDIERINKFEYNLSMDYVRQEQYDKALERLEKGKARVQESGNQEMEGLYNKGVGNCYFWLGDVQEAVRYALMAYDNFASAQSPKRQAHVCYDLAESYGELQDFAQGERYFLEGKEIAQALEDDVLIADFVGLARAYPVVEQYRELKDAQRAAIEYVKAHGSIANREYQDLNRVSQRTASRHLRDLVERKIFNRLGENRETVYRMWSP